MAKQDQSNPNESSGVISNAVLSISAVTAITTLPWIWMSIGQFGGFAWGVFGFELIILIGCLMTMLASIGKVRVGLAFPMSITCLVGTLLVGAVFGIHVDARNVVGPNPDIAPWVNRTLMFRLIIIMFLSLIATLDVYRRDSRSWGLVLRSVIFLVPVLICLGWIKARGMPSISDSSGELSPILMIVVLLIGLTLGILLSIGGHFLIRAFEIAIPENDQDTQDPKSDDKTAKKPA